MNLDNFFKAKSVAIIGVSKDPQKVGHVVFKNLVDGGYKGKIFIVNPNATEILGKVCYPSVTKIKDRIEFAVIAVPSNLVLKVIDDCARKRIKDILILSAGFKEIGNKKLEEQLKEKIKKYGMRMIGPNCLGVLDARTKQDTVFLPRNRMTRPKPGGISFITQSGAVGSAVLDYSTKQGQRFAKFVSYGNATTIDESDILEYMGKDKDTRVICLYLEGISNGKKFLETAKKVARKKPIIAIKGGVTEAGAKASLSHTGSLAGKAEVYHGVFRQANIIIANSVEEMFNYARIFENCFPPKGDRVQIITDGGGYGIMTADAVYKYGLRMAEMSARTKTNLVKSLPKNAIIGNPIDVIGDATTERYKLALNQCITDKNIDILAVILLAQVPLLTTDVVDVITGLNDKKIKPMVVIMTGGDFSDLIKRSLEEKGVPCFTFPENAVQSIAQLVKYNKVKRSR
ncbi:CoA-binding protein [Candidatus Woesearchaeota archaeon]|nr:CoA-binding protein [Candidatus Woesearchaeota archaeon]